MECPGKGCSINSKRNGIFRVMQANKSRWTML
uniref:Uncharacterized protein n=1 Tax=Arundo donax TaxID=35708 RepID=A0A0A9HQA8_ARUDO